MSGEAAAVGVIRGNVGGTARVQGLYVDQRISPWTVHPLNNDVRAVLEAGPRASHELLQSLASGGALSENVGDTEEAIETDDKGMDGWVVAGPGEADAVLA